MSHYNLLGGKQEKKLLVYVTCMLGSVMNWLAMFMKAGLFIIWPKSICDRSGIPPGVAPGIPPAMPPAAGGGRVRVLTQIWIKSFFT